ncbi:hypothetical protein BI347_11975 [Chromobacterium sphagni]|uniref:Uncharacterized protein n=1 Tax=Chromobacterium sphagni TaxID=1903179 RepID=A0A1S1X3Z0_9NEIS|nr:hypothetical protein BI347_11975 [Chromobacterium sphagni]
MAGVGLLAICFAIQQAIFDMGIAEGSEVYGGAEDIICSGEQVAPSLEPCPNLGEGNIAYLAAEGLVGAVFIDLAVDDFRIAELQNMPGAAG